MMNVFLRYRCLCEIRNAKIVEQKQKNWGDSGIEPETSRTQSENHATRPITLQYYITNSKIS